VSSRSDVHRDADKSSAFLISFTFILLILLSHQNVVLTGEMSLENLYSSGCCSKKCTAMRSEARTVFSHSNTRLVGSNPTRSTDVCMCLFCVCVFVFVCMCLCFECVFVCVCVCV
jgi:hypothetical protein